MTSTPGRPAFPRSLHSDGFASSQGGTPSDSSVRGRHKRREAAMKALRAKGLPLGVCAVALHQSDDDVEKALTWLQHGRGLQLLRAYEAARDNENGAKEGMLAVQYQAVHLATLLPRLLRPY